MISSLLTFILFNLVDNTPKLVRDSSESITVCLPAFSTAAISFSFITGEVFPAGLFTSFFVVIPFLISSGNSV